MLYVFVCVYIWVLMYVCVYQTQSQKILAITQRKEVG